MDIEARLAEIGLTKAELADRFGVKRSAVSNWIKRGKLPGRIERALGMGREEDVIGRFEVGDQAMTSNWQGVVVRRDYFETEKSTGWLYYLAELRKGEKGWYRWGPITRWTDGMLREVSEVVEVVKSPTGKSGKGSE